MARVNIALIGAGRIGRVHARNLARHIQGVNLMAVMDVNRQAAADLALELGIPNVYDDPQLIFSDQAIQAVVICSSTDTHARFIEEAALAGKDIFCEKPIALDLPSIDRALAAVERQRVKLQVGFNRRFDPSFNRLRTIVSQGKIGTPHLLRITSRDPTPPPISYIKVSGGIFLDMTIHDFDMARYVMGDEVEEVYATGSVLVDQAIGQAGDVDTAVTVLRFRSGALGVIDNSRKAVYGYDQRVEVFGSAGMALVANKAADQVVTSDEAGVHATKPLYFFVERYTEAYLLEMQEFVRCLLEDRTPPVTGIDGRIPIVMAYAAKRSLAERRPVRLAEVDTRR